MLHNSNRGQKAGKPFDSPEYEISSMKRLRITLSSLSGFGSWIEYICYTEKKQVKGKKNHTHLQNISNIVWENIKTF